MAWTPVASCAALEQGDVRAVDCSGFASPPLRTFPTRVEDDVIYVDLPMAEERMP